MATHELYKRIAEGIKKDPDFHIKHSQLIDEAYRTGTESEKKLIESAEYNGRKDKLLAELSARILTGEGDENLERPRSIISSQAFQKQAYELLKQEYAKAYKKEASK